MGTSCTHIRIRNRFGLHMRPAAEISRRSYNFDAIIAFHKDDRIAHAHSVVELLTLGVFYGDEIKLTAIGTDAVEALTNIVSFLEKYTDETEPNNGDPNSAAA